MAQLVVTYWRDIPSMVEARRGRKDKAKRMLPERFQEAIDRAAMRAGAGTADEYLADWRKADPEPCGEVLEAEVERAVAALDAAYDEVRLKALVGSGGREN
jgi:hypothetical protein